MAEKKLTLNHLHKRLLKEEASLLSNIQLLAILVDATPFLH
jgi:hypothetical protein